MALLGLVAPCLAMAADSPAPPMLGAALATALPDAEGAPASFEEDLDEPVIVFGRAVDLAGTAIEPQRRVSGMAGAAGHGAFPRGRPLAAAHLTSGFGPRVHPIQGGLRFHAGVDLAAPAGTPVRATSAGRVARAGWAGGYGNLIAISHAGAVETRYGHLSAVAVRAGDMVREGQIIGYVGSTGNSTGPHLHYETRVAGQARDPARAWSR